jgi:hypothetical protein
VTRCLPLRVVPSNRRQRVVATTGRLPDIRHPELPCAVVLGRRAARRARRRTAERLGRPALSRPGLDGLDRKLEARALRGLDLDRHAPHPVLVEMREIGAMRAGIEGVLGDRYAPVEALSPFDVLYRRVGDD